MRNTLLLSTVLMILASAPAFADEEKSAKEGFKEIHQGMKKIVHAAGTNTKKGAKKIGETTKKTLKKAGHEIEKAAKN